MKGTPRQGCSGIFGSIVSDPDIRVSIGVRNIGPFKEWPGSEVGFLPKRPSKKFNCGCSQTHRAVSRTAGKSVDLEARLAEFEQRDNFNHPAA
jgi:hypothetical protein